jgi:L-asparaginase
MQVDRNRIVVLGTGGTLAGTASTPGDNVGYRAAQIGVEQLVSGLPGLEGLPVTCEQVAQVDSKDMTEAVWLALAKRCGHWLAQPDVRGIVVTHGTDTLEETAYFLHRTLDATAKPVVITCAMRPATALGADGPRNILDAISVAREEGAKGVSAVCAGVIHDAVHVAKVHPYRLDPFRSDEAGPLGYVEEGRVRLVRPWAGTSPDAYLPEPDAWPRVEIVLSHAGASGRIVEALVRDGVQGIVAAGTGNGTLHQSLVDALLAAQAAGVLVVRATRCPEGQIVRHEAEEFPASEVAPVKARIDLLLELLSRPARPARGQ